MRKKPIISVKKTSENYVLYIGKTPVFTNKMPELVAEAAFGAENYYLKLAEESEERKQDLALRRAAWFQNIQEHGKTGETLPRGIKRKGLKYVVSSPRHLGSFNTLEEALEAKANAPVLRKLKSRIDFELLPSTKL